MGKSVEGLEFAEPPKASVQDALEQLKQAEQLLVRARQDLSAHSKFNHQGLPR